MHNDKMHSEACASVSAEHQYLGMNKNIIYGLQHVLTMYGGIIAPPIIIGAAAGLEASEIGLLVAAALFVGGMIPVIFSALAMQSVGKAAMQMVQEVRRQFKEIPGILEGTGKPEYGKCVAISTQAALREMILPGLITIIVPIIIGLLFGAEPLGGYMAGVCVSGVMWAIFQNNAGGAWDNAKKAIEQGHIEGEKKGTEAHSAAVIGDTIGDPFKDTSGPSLNILIKLMSIVAVVIAPNLDAIGYIGNLI